MLLMLNSMVGRAICKIFSVRDNDTFEDVKHLLNAFEIQMLCQKSSSRFMNSNLFYSWRDVIVMFAICVLF